DMVHVEGMKLEYAELPLGIENAGFGFGHRLQRHIAHMMDGERWRDLDDERMHALERYIAPGACGRSHIGGKLPPQGLELQIDAKLRHGEKLLRTAELLDHVRVGPRDNMHRDDFPDIARRLGARFRRRLDRADIALHLHRAQPGPDLLAPNN